MYGFIFGFHRLARCPKCTPASISSFTANATASTSRLHAISGPRIPRATGPGRPCLRTEPPEVKAPQSNGWPDRRQTPQGGPTQAPAHPTRGGLPEAQKSPRDGGDELEHGLLDILHLEGLAQDDQAV